MQPSLNLEPVRMLRRCALVLGCVSSTVAFVGWAFTEPPARLAVAEPVEAVGVAVAQVEATADVEDCQQAEPVRTAVLVPVGPDDEYIEGLDWECEGAL